VVSENTVEKSNLKEFSNPENLKTDQNAFVKGENMIMSTHRTPVSVNIYEGANSGRNNKDKCSTDFYNSKNYLGESKTAFEVKKKYGSSTNLLSDPKIHEGIGFVGVGVGVIDHTHGAFGKKPRVGASGAKKANANRATGNTIKITEYTDNSNGKGVDPRNLSGYKDFSTNGKNSIIAEGSRVKDDDCHPKKSLKSHHGVSRDTKNFEKLKNPEADEGQLKGSTAGSNNSNFVAGNNPHSLNFRKKAPCV
jgi:hypothetical protein